MLTNPELRQEAERLLALSDDGLQVEAVALALRIGNTSAKAAEVLHQLDLRTVELMFDGTQVRSE